MSKEILTAIRRPKEIFPLYGSFVNSKLPSWTQSEISYLYDALEGLMALLVGSTLGQVPPDPNILTQENFTVLLKPVKHLQNK